MKNSVSKRLNLLFWEYFPTSSTYQQSLTGHLLVVKKEKYSEISRICVLSFLHYHPKSKVIIHVDGITLRSVQKWVDRSRLRNKIRIKLINDEIATWQNQKMELIFSLTESNEFFVDADMRWNANIQKSDFRTNHINFFVDEYKISEHHLFGSMIKSQEFSMYRDARMWNTSFVCLSGFLLSQMQKTEITRLQERIIKYANVSIKNQDDCLSTIRISEQLAISLAASNWGLPLNAVKKQDGYKDGTFLESSYFGATGTHF